MQSQVTSPQTHGTPRPAIRLLYLDWLRLPAILIVFIYHSTRFFNRGTLKLKNPTWYPGVEVWNRFATAWLLPLLFILSGASLFYTVGKRAAPDLGRPDQSVPETGTVGPHRAEKKEMPVASPTPRPNRKVERRRDLDLLRVLLVFGLIFFHTARIFDVIPLPEGVKNEPASVTATIFVAFFSLWGMPLMMAISGFAIWHSLRRRTGRVFLHERLQRLLVPFVFGVLIIVPPQVYYHLKQTDPAGSLTYWQFLPQFFDVRLCPDPLSAFVCPDPATGLFTVAHLWYLRDLFIFSVVLLPLFLYLRGQGGRRVVGSLASFLARPGALLLLGLPVAVVEAGLVTSNMGGGWNEYSYVVLLVWGFLIATDPRYGQAMGRGWWIALLVGLIAEVIYVAGLYVLLEVYAVDPLHSYDWGSILWRLVKGIGAWAWVAAILGFGSRPRPERALRSPPHPSVSGSVPLRPGLGTRVLAYVGEAFLAVYILHQTVVFVIGYYVVQWHTAALLKYMVISLAALVVTLLLYEFGVRRAPVTRWLFGMRPLQAGKNGQ